LEKELKILLKNGFVSRKQLRKLISRQWIDIEEMKTHLLDAGIIDIPDWKEAQKQLSEQGGKEIIPDSRNPEMQNLINTARQVANSNTTILILGESGAGKSTLARTIHNNSLRSRGPFVTVSCGSIPETLLESELFGVEKGAYTGAVKTRAGRFLQAHEGTIFLDEIGEISPAIQVKLLHVIQEKRIEPLGSSKEIHVDVRLIAATSRNLEEEVKAGRFRNDLFFRLNVVPLTMLPLRDRKDDILTLSEYFIQQFSKKDGIEYSANQDEFKDILLSYSWPGNIRELENCIERLSVLSKNGKLRIEDLPPCVIKEVDFKPQNYNLKSYVEHERPRQNHIESKANVLKMPVSNFPSLKDIERHYIVEALKISQGNVFRAASLLKIHRNTLSRKLETMQIDPASFKLKSKKHS